MVQSSQNLVVACVLPSSMLYSFCSEFPHGIVLLVIFGTTWCCCFFGCYMQTAFLVVAFIVLV